MAKMEAYFKTAVPILLVMLLLASVMSGCSRNRKYTLYNGAVRFSLEYPPSYLPPNADTDQSENPVGLRFDLRHPEQDPMRDAYIWVDVIRTSGITPDYIADLEFDLVVAQADQLEGQFQLVERSPITVDGAQGEQAVYRYMWRTVVDGSPKLNIGTPATTYAAYFEHNGFVWSIGVKSTADRADEAKADFELMVRSFRFPD